MTAPKTSYVHDDLDRLNPNQMHPEASVREWEELCIYLGGSPDSWTGKFLELLHKSDPAHRELLRQIMPNAVAAWQLWMEHPADTMTVADMEARL